MASFLSFQRLAYVLLGKFGIKKSFEGGNRLRKRTFLNIFFCFSKKLFLGRFEPPRKFQSSFALKKQKLMSQSAGGQTCCFLGGGNWFFRHPKSFTARLRLSPSKSRKPCKGLSRYARQRCVALLIFKRFKFLKTSALKTCFPSIPRPSIATNCSAHGNMRLSQTTKQLHQI